MKANKLNVGDKVAIVSLSSGMLGEPWAKHELELGDKRLKELGLVPMYMEYALKGIEFVKDNPQKRVEDLKSAFENKDVKAIICAIGGSDSYKIIPYIFENNNVKQIIKNNPKIFTGYSDITIVHFILRKLGLNTFYGPAFITDFAEFELDMLPYTYDAVKKFFENKLFDIESSDIWYKERVNFGKDQIGVKRISNKENHGYISLGKDCKAQGELLGGCIDVIGRMLGVVDDGFDNKLNSNIIECQKIVDKYKIFPTKKEWVGKILMIETSDEKPSPNYVKKVLDKLKHIGILKVINGVLIGKPIDEIYFDEYISFYKDYFKKYNIPIIYNVNFGHSYPRGIMPIGVKCEIDAKNKKIKIIEKMFNN